MSTAANRLKVFCRLRIPPPEPQQQQQPSPPELFRLNSQANTLELENKTSYSFHRIFSQSSQAEIFEAIMWPLLKDALVLRI
jgi:hypothetical protein